MNRFIIDTHPDEIAKQLCDQHIVKMPLEEAQMLCTALRFHAPEYAEEHNIYKSAYAKHPCTQWAMETRENYKFAYSLYASMLCEYHHRYGKWHGAGKHSEALYNGIDLIPEGDLTRHPQCFSGYDDLKTDEAWPVIAYRRFYRVDKIRFARYNKGRSMPDWLSEGLTTCERKY